MKIVKAYHWRMKVYLITARKWGRQNGSTPLERSNQRNEDIDVVDISAPCSKIHADIAIAAGQKR
ncbi:MAG: hypothetical protein U5N58_01490 [Actinomycetota bacterium]|nr:hypothetical protein [Actinomycetota bacterium]